MADRDEPRAWVYLAPGKLWTIDDLYECARYAESLRRAPAFDPRSDWYLSQLGDA